MAIMYDRGRRWTYQYLLYRFCNSRIPNDCREHVAKKKIKEKKVISEKLIETKLF